MISPWFYSYFYSWCFLCGTFVSLYNVWSFNWAELQVVPDEHSYPPVADKVTSRQTWLKLLLGCVLHSNSEIEKPRVLVYWLHNFTISWLEIGYKNGWLAVLKVLAYPTSQNTKNLDFCEPTLELLNMFSVSRVKSKLNFILKERIILLFI